MKSFVFIQADDAEERRQNLDKKITIEEDCSLPKPIRVFYKFCVVLADKAYSHDNKHQIFKFPQCLYNLRITTVNIHSFYIIIPFKALVDHDNKHHFLKTKKKILGEYV